MGNINMPAPVAFAGGALCLLGGYLVGVVAGPDTNDRTTAEVVSFEPGNEELCLTGDAVADQPRAEDGVLCGTWRRGIGSETPQAGDAFRFVVMTSESAADDDAATYIYGDVVD